MSDSIMAIRDRPIRDRIELGFEAWGRWVTRRPFRVILATALVSAGLLSQLPQLRVDVSDEAFLHSGDPVRIAYESYMHEFGTGGAVIALESPEIFDIAFLTRLRALHEEIEAVPQIEEVTSLINARVTRGQGDELIVEDLLEEWPSGAEDLARLRERALANPLYRNTLISEDGGVTLMVVKADRYSSLGASSDALEGFAQEVGAGATVEAPFLTQDETLAIAHRLIEVVERHDTPEFPLYAAGDAIFELWMSDQMQVDIRLSVTAATVMIAVLLFLLFRRFWGVVLSLLVVVLALLCTGATMALFGVAVSLPIQVLPSFLLAVGICGAVHILVLVYRSVDAGEERAEAISGALRHAGLPVLMSGLTTAGGLVSFMTSSLAPVSHFGIFGPIGVLYSTLFVLVLLPALLAVVPLRARVSRGGAGTPLMDRVLAGFGHVATRHPGAVVSVSFGLIVLAFVGLQRLEFSHYPLDWLPPESDVRTAALLMNERMNNADGIELLIETPGVEDGLKDPELLARLDLLRERVLAFEFGGLQAANTTSLADILKETHQALNENRPEFYRVPRDADLVAQELLLFENAGPDEIDDFVDSRFSTANFSVMHRWVDAMDSVAYIDQIEAMASETIGDAAVVTLTGPSVIFSRTFAAVIQSMARSYGLALLIVTPLMILLIGTVRGGLISMAPNLTPILLTLGWMGFVGLHLDFSTMMIGAIVLGIAVDDTIHFLHVFQRYYRESGDAPDAIQKTLATTGRAILVTSVVLCIGFAGNFLATMQNMVNMGVITCAAIATALLADLLLAPALLTLLLRGRAGAAGGGVGEDEGQPV